MQIEMDLTVTKAIGNLTFTSTETEAVFILLGHLPGFLQEKIEVSVNETGTEISISGAGEKSSFETVIESRLRLKNEFENSSFRKVFRIPTDVALDQINACFCEDKDILMILMPKSSISEVSGREIQEVEEQEEASKEKQSEGDTKIQIGTTSSASDGNGDGRPEHMESENSIPRQKQEEPGKNTDVPENLLAETETSTVNGEPASPAVASKAIDEEEHEEPAEKKRIQDQQSEKGNEKHESKEADRDLDQPKRHHHEKQMEQKDNARDLDQPEEKEKEDESTEAPKSNGDLHQTEEEMVKRIEAPVLEEHEVPQSIKTVQAAETNEMEQQEDREPVSESIETPKYVEPPEMDQRTETPKYEEPTEMNQRTETPKYDEPTEMNQRTETPKYEEPPKMDQRTKTPKYEEPPKMDQRTEAPIGEEDEEGEGRNRNRQKASVRKKKRNEDAGVTAPTLILSAFVLSMVALFVDLVRSRRRR